MTSSNLIMTKEDSLQPPGKIDFPILPLYSKNIFLLLRALPTFSRKQNLSSLDITSKRQEGHLIKLCRILKSSGDPEKQ